MWCRTWCNVWCENLPHVVQRVLSDALQEAVACVAARGAWSVMTDIAPSKRRNYKMCKAPDVSYQVLFSFAEVLMRFFVQFIWNLRAYTFTILIINKSGVQSKYTLIRRNTCIAYAKYIYDRRMMYT